MTQDRIWAPWRLEYVQGDKKEPTGDKQSLQLPPCGDIECFLCQAVADLANDRERGVVARTERSIVVLNRYPYNNGHLLVAPQRHVARLDELEPAEQFELTQSISRMINLLESKLGPQGFNVGLNLGQIAGAGLPGHVHWHIVPRWSGDTNFMPVLANVRVIPQSLDALWELLTDAS